MMDEKASLSQPSGLFHHYSSYSSSSSSYNDTRPPPVFMSSSSFSFGLDLPLNRGETQIFKGEIEMPTPTIHMTANTSKEDEKMEEEEEEEEKEEEDKMSHFF